MKRLCTFCIFFIAVSIQNVLFPSVVDAQDTVKCGESIQSTISNYGDVHEYHINMNNNSRLIIYSELETKSYSDLVVDVGIVAPSGYIINGLVDFEKRAGISPIETTDVLSETGIYSINVIGFTRTGGAYTLFVSCVDQEGIVTSSTNLVRDANCGSIIDNEFSSYAEIHRYYIQLAAGDRVKLLAETTGGSYSDLVVDVGIEAPNGYVINGLVDFESRSGINSSENTDSLPMSGIYILNVIGFTRSGGPYTLYVGCILANGTVINPGDAPPVDLASPAEVLPSESASQPVFSGFGFPGVASIDFSSGIEIPLQTGQSQTVPVGSDIALYTYEANADEMRTLNISRLSGNISLGVSVINRDTNEIIFFGGLPSSDNLSVELTFPSSGTYAIGLFRVDTSERSGTSGAVQITLE
ncbi:hypothetical protein MASR2M15_09630 [Anaerolineales bacterium]